MSLSLRVLASGSSGNAAAVRTPGGVVLIDAGIGPRTTARRLGAAAMADVAAVVLTHLDRDHLAPAWADTLVSRNVPIFCADREYGRLLGIAPQLEKVAFGFAAGEAFEPAAGVTFDPIALDHDAAGSHGFVVASEAGRLGYATDLGRVPPTLFDQFTDLDIVAIESNYDPQMQFASGRPAFLQRRITGGRGHLSNGQALSAVRKIFDDHAKQGRRPPGHVVLLHRSRQCNCPHLLRSLFAADVRLARRLTLAEQHDPTGWLDATTNRSRPHEQLPLFGT